MDVKKKQDSGLALSNAFSDQSMALSSSPQYVLLVRAYVRKWKNGKTNALFCGKPENPKFRSEF